MSQANWKYGRRHPACVDCGREFEEGEAHFSQLEVSEEAELLRLDVCTACWKRRAPSPEAIWWRARRREAQRAGLAIDMEGLEAIFHQLADRPEQRHRELRYVLCLLLMRKRRLLMNRAVRRKGGEALLVRRPRRKEDIEVEVFDLAPERMDEIRDGLQRLFEGEGLGAEEDAADGPGPAGVDQAGVDQAGAEEAGAEEAGADQAGADRTEDDAEQGAEPFAEPADEPEGRRSEDDTSEPAAARTGAADPDDRR